MKSIRSVGVKLSTKRTHFVAFSRPPPNQKKKRYGLCFFCFQQTNSRRKWKKNKVISESNSKSIIAADDHLIFSKQHPSICWFVSFLKNSWSESAKVNEKRDTIVCFQFVPVSFEVITNCLRFITLRTFAQSTDAKQQNRQNEIANIRREQIIHVEKA